MLFGQQPVGGTDLRQRAAAIEAELGVVVGSRAVQAASLMGDRIHVSFIYGRGFFTSGQQVRALKQAAEILFAGDNFGAGLAGEVGVGFIFHFEAFETDDPDELAILFPDLGLGEFHGGKDKNFQREAAQVKKVCLSCFYSGETITSNVTSFWQRAFWRRPFSGRVWMLWI